MNEFGNSSDNFARNTLNVVTVPCKAMPVKSKKPRRSRFVCTAEQKHEVCVYAVQNPTLTCNQIARDMSSKYNIDLKRRTVQDIVAERDYWLDPEKASSSSRRRSRPRYEQLESALLVWYKDQRSRNLGVTGSMIIEQAKTFAHQLGETSFGASNNWFDAFKARNKIQTAYSKAGDSESVSNFWKSSVST